MLMTRKVNLLNSYLDQEDEFLKCAYVMVTDGRGK